MPKRFPTDKLRPKGGSITALLFENPTADVPLDLYWSLEVDFEEFQLGEGEDGETLTCNAQLEWMRLGLRDWRQLVGREITSKAPGEGFEASFCAGTHLWSEETRLVFPRREGAGLDIELDLRVDLSSVLGTSEESTAIATALRLPFEGVMVYFDLVDPEKGDGAAALAAALPFIDPAAYGEPELRTNRFGVTAWWLPPKL